MMAAATAVLGHIPSQAEIEDLMKEEVTA